MRNTILTASFIKDVLDFANKYHLTDITISNRYELHCGDGYRLEDKITGNKVENKDKKMFIEKLKLSPMYRVEIKGGNND